MMIFLLLLYVHYNYVHAMKGQQLAEMLFSSKHG